MRRLALLLAALTVIVFGAAHPAVAQDDDGPEGSPPLDGEIQILKVDEGSDGQITLQIAVPLSIGELTPTESNFGVTDGGQLINNFNVGAVTTAVDAVVVLDTSGSMRGDALAAAKAAATTFVEELPESAGVGLVSFADTVTVHQRPGADRANTITDISNLEASGETALWDGLVAAAELVEDSEQPFVIVLSDGEDTVSSAMRPEAVGQLREVNAGLYAVAIESPDTDLVALEDAVGDVGGQFFDTNDLSELQSLYSDIAGRLASRYELRFRSLRDDARTVVVSVAAGDRGVATARVNLGQGRVSESFDDAATPQVINVPDDARLGLVPAPSPGLLGGANTLWIGAGLMFAALAVMGVLMTVQTRQIQLNTAAGADRVAGLNSRFSSAADRLIARRDEEGTLDKALDAAGMNVRPGEFVLMTIIGSVAVALLFGLIGGTIAGILAVPLAVVGTLASVSVRANRRRDKFADQLIETLAILAGGLRAGRGLPQAIELVANEAPSPTAEQFQRVVFETRVGRDLTESVLSVADRMRSQDLEWVARAMDINRELGGDLTEALDNVADTIRDRRRISRQVQALSAEGRASGIVLLSLPILMFLFLLWRTPDSARLLLTDSTGRILGLIAVSGMIIGAFWIRKLVNIKF